MTSAPPSTSTADEAAPPPGRRRAPVGSRILGGVGELLITAGVLLGLFVVWQLWWTDVEGEQQAASAVAELEESLPPVPEVAGTPRTDTPPVEVAAAAAEVFATLYVPDWGTDYAQPIAEGVDRPTVLDAGRVGHYPETAQVGQVGNFSVAGHRQTYGKPFYSIDTLAAGDEIIVRTAQAWYVYEVTTSEVVRPSEVEVIAPVPGDPEAVATEEMLTLTTCHPLWSTRERYIVHAHLDHWIPLTDGLPAALLPEGS
ncbi:class E sortase [Occultella glacieicola]|uniref:Class E sortase n=1 Tax=Occultella glacieicola TaxID=2518684 RepID=A0ABY2E8B5_9MICO|nr:class E sortase [Occultella glacieicola]TDE98732.1 class E sortase [Occultella glacieicola]